MKLIKNKNRWNKKPPRSPLIISCSLEISPKIELKYRKWQKEQEKKVAKLLKKAGKQMGQKGLYVESSSIGGQYEYIFVPTSIGMVLKVKNLLTGDIVDLTDYNTW